MVMNALFERQLGCKGSSFDAVTSCVLEDLHCWRLNQHHFENADGELVPPLACVFNPECPNLLAVADECGGLLFLNTDKPGPLAVSTDFLAHNNMIWDLSWLPGGQNLLTASGDQTIALWDIETETKINVYKGHTSSVRTLHVCYSQPAVFATGSMDGNIFIWDRRKKCRGDASSHVGAVLNAHKCKAASEGKKTKKFGPARDNKESVTSVIFQDSNNLISSGSRDGVIKVWDVRKLTSSSKVTPLPADYFPYAGCDSRPRGYSSLVLDSSKTKLYANCMDNHVYAFDCAGFSSKPVATFQGHRVSSFFVKLAISPEDDYLLSGSSDNQAYIWSTSNPRSSPLLLQGHTAEVPAVAWSPADLGRVVTTSDDCSLMIWHSLRGADKEEIHPVLGPVVGRVHRICRDVGTSASGSPMRVPPLTPRKGRTVPPSPAKVSAATREALMAMQGLPCSIGAKPCLTSNCQSTIVKWLGKSPAPRMQTTPRKLIITPKKSPPDAENKEPRGVKRKLDSGFDKLVSQRNENSSPSGKSPRKTGTPLRPLSPDLLNSPDHKNAKKALFEEDGSPKRETPVKRLCREADGVSSQSPTANLPNYVANPEPRAPQGQVTPHTTDWLTQHRRQKGENSPALSKVASRGRKTPGSSSKRASQPPSTPKTPKGTPLLRKGSILQYLSPKD